MKARSALLERRKQYLSAKISAQRNQLGAQLEGFRGPLHAFEVARGVGEAMRRHAPLIGGVAALLGFGAMRGGLVSKSFRAFRLATRTTRWLGVARVALQIAQRMRARPA
jgi:hypothetical protein